MLSDGTEVDVGKTPLSLRRHRGAPAETYAFEKAGYQRFQRSFDFMKDQVETVRLIVEKKPASKVNKAKTRAAPKKAKKAKKTDTQPFEYAPGKVGTTKSSPY